MAAKKGPSSAKAKEILKHGEVHGKPLTPAQKGFMGARAGGEPIKHPGGHRPKPSKPSTPKK